MKARGKHTLASLSPSSFFASASMEDYGLFYGVGGFGLSGNLCCIFHKRTGSSPLMSSGTRQSLRRLDLHYI